MPQDPDEARKQDILNATRQRNDYLRSLQHPAAAALGSPVAGPANIPPSSTSVSPQCVFIVYSVMIYTKIISAGQTRPSSVLTPPHRHSPYHPSTPQHAISTVRRGGCMYYLVYIELYLTIWE
jgi:hypothetical protein